MELNKINRKLNITTADQNKAFQILDQMAKPNSNCFVSVKRFGVRKMISYWFGVEQLKAGTFRYLLENRLIEQYFQTDNYITFFATEKGLKHSTANSDIEIEEEPPIREVARLQQITPLMRSFANLINLVGEEYVKVALVASIEYLREEEIKREQNLNKILKELLGE